MNLALTSKKFEDIGSLCLDFNNFIAVSQIFTGELHESSCGMNGAPRKSGNAGSEERGGYPDS